MGFNIFKPFLDFTAIFYVVFIYFVFNSTPWFSEYIEHKIAKTHTIITLKTLGLLKPSSKLRLGKKDKLTKIKWVSKKFSQINV